MRTCKVKGDSPVEGVSDQYPIVPVCNECLADLKQMGEYSTIIETGEYNPDYGDICEYCEKSLEEEIAEEQGENRSSVI